MKNTAKAELHCEYTAIIKELIEGSQVDINQIRKLYKVEKDPNDPILNTLISAISEKKLASAGMSIPEIIQSYGQMAAYNAKLGCFESLLKDCGFPFCEIISTYSYFLLPLEKNQNLANGASHQLVFLTPESDITFNPSLPLFWIKNKNVESFFEIKRISSRQMVMLNNVKVGVHQDEKTPFILPVRYPLTVFSLLVKSIGPSLELKKTEPLNKVFIRSLSNKYNNVVKNSDLFIESYKNKSISFEEKTEVLTNDEPAINLFKLLWNYRRDMIKKIKE